MLKTQGMSQGQEEISVETVIFRLYFKVIRRLNEDDFEMKSKYHNFNKNFWQEIAPSEGWQLFKLRNSPLKCFVFSCSYR